MDPILTFDARLGIMQIMEAWQLSLPEKLIVIALSLGVGSVLTLILHSWLSKPAAHECSDECNSIPQLPGSVPAFMDECACGKPAQMDINGFGFCSWECVPKELIYQEYNEQSG